LDFKRASFNGTYGGYSRKPDSGTPQKVKLPSSYNNPFIATIKTPKKEAESDKMMDLNYAHPGRGSSGKKSL
jgi:hypothetical protein